MPKFYERNKKPMKKKILAALLCAAVLLSSSLGDMPLTVGAAAYENEPSAEETTVLDLEYGASTLAAPTASKESGTITVTKDYPKIKLSAEKGTIYYSLNGGEYQKYTSAITITKNSTIKAYAQSGSTKSKTVTFKYKLKPKVTITVKKITGSYLVEFDTKVDRVTLYYTTDGSEPTTSSEWYRFSPLRITSTTKIRVLAVKDGWTNAKLSKNVTIAGSSPVAPTKSTEDIYEDPSTEISTETLSDGTLRWINITTDVSPVFAYSMKTKDLWYTGAVFDEVVFPSEINGIPVESVAVHGEYVNPGRIKSITIPDTVTRLGGNGDGAFGGCSSITSLVLPDGITSIGPNEFRRCVSLKSVNIPDGVTEFGECAFMGCESLKSINIPDGITEIKNHTFDGCKSLKSVTIPDGVRYLGSRAFADCTSLKSVTIPDSVEVIAGDAFSGCTSLKSVTLPDTLKDIWGSVWFDGCTCTVTYKGKKYTSKDNYEALYKALSGK